MLACPTHFSTCLAVTTLLVSFYVLKCCVPGLSCCDETDSAAIGLETSHLDGKHPSQVLVAYDKLVTFQIWSALFYGLLWSEAGYLNTKDSSVT